MDFFESQDVARKRTSLLVVYFLLAVLVIIIAVYVAVAAIFFYASSKTPGTGELGRLWHPALFAGITIATASLIAVGSLYKISRLSGGGGVVASLLGGRPINPGTRDLNERVVLNVVEEMAIASGTPVPPVFLLESEEGINAFAAGFRPNDAVIGVTRGTIETLSRDELQGVIAHEFSHILNGDMRLNIRLMGLLNGILLIGLAGYWILRSTSSSSSGSRRGKKDGGSIALLGLALLAIGYIGVFFARLIKSAVSRQREFLADASAVQFTRNPPGIAGALKKIGGITGGSRIENAKAEEASHLFFGNALKASFLNLMSTHPPLGERIRRIDPSFDGRFPAVRPVERTEAELTRAAVPDRQELVRSIQARSEAPPDGARSRRYAFRPEDAVSSIGAPGAEHVRYAAALVSLFPTQLVEAVHEPVGALATVYSLLLSEDERVRDTQLAHLAEHAEPGVYAETRRIMPLARRIGPEARLPLVEMALPSFGRLSPRQHDTFQSNIHHLVEADQSCSLFEYALERIISDHLVTRLGKTRSGRTRPQPIKGPKPAFSNLLATLAHLGHADTGSAARAYAEGLARMGLDVAHHPMEPRQRCGLESLDRVLDAMAASSPQLKKRMIEACAACIGSDGRITVEEGELLRVIASALNCPMPPLLASGA